MNKTGIDLIAIIGDSKEGLSEELGRLLSTHNIPIITDKEDKTRGLCLSWVQRDSEESLNKAMKESLPLKREAKRELLRKLRKNIKLSN